MGSEVGGCHLKCECGGAHRQGPAAVKGVDGCLGLSVGLELDKGAAYSIREQGGKGEGLPSRAPNVSVAREPGGEERKGQRAQLGKREPLGTFAGAIWPPEHSAFVYGPKRLEHLPDVLICLLLP